MSGTIKRIFYRLCVYTASIEKRGIQLNKNDFNKYVTFLQTTYFSIAIKEIQQNFHQYIDPLTEYGAEKITHLIATQILIRDKNINHSSNFNLAKLRTKKIKQTYENQKLIKQVNQKHDTTALHKLLTIDINENTYYALMRTKKAGAKYFTKENFKSNLKIILLEKMPRGINLNPFEFEIENFLEEKTNKTMNWELIKSTNDQTAAIKELNQLNFIKEYKFFNTYLQNAAKN